MISTSPTKLEAPRPADGSLRDLNPYRRQARLRAAGVAIERDGWMRRLVRFPDGSTRLRRTFAGAERTAHSFLDRRDRDLPRQEWFEAHTPDI